MAVTVLVNGGTLNPQPADVDWEPNIIEQKLNGVDGLGAYYVVTLRAPVDYSGSANWNWDSYDNTVLSSIVLPAPYESMKTGSGTTYSSGVVSRAIRRIESPVGGLIKGIEMQVQVIV